MTSHDIVNKVRSVFNEKRVGHAGTLDPAASGVLPVCVGSATKLCSYLGEGRKLYEARIVFGTETTTDDAEGEVIERGKVPARVSDASYARQMLLRFTGRQMQTPPRYSAVKQHGVKSYEAARKNMPFEQKEREITVYSAELEMIQSDYRGEDPLHDRGRSSKECGRQVVWDVDFSVSKGTYIRSLARDIGRACGTYAHIGGLKRLRVGSLWLSDCVGLQTLADVKERAALDPLVLLGLRYAFAEGKLSRAVENGAAIEAERLQLMKPKQLEGGVAGISCVPDVRPSDDAVSENERIALLVDNRLRAIYSYNALKDAFEALTVFQIGVSRGFGI